MAGRIGFSGFLTGSQVSVTAGGKMRATGQDGWGVATASSTPRATIVPKRSDLRIAPEGINFEVILENFDTPGPQAGTGSYDPRFHEVYYVWDFGDPGSTFTAPENILEEHRNANIAYGPLASHTYAAPGTYTVTVDVIEPSSGKTAQATLPVLVGNPADMFAGFRTLYVDPDGDFSGAPSGSLQFTSVAAAFARSAQTSSNAEYYRIMLARGKTHAWLNPLQFRGGYNNLYVTSAPGAGEPATLNAYRDDGGLYVLTDNISVNQVGRRTDIVFNDLNIIGPWDSATQEPNNVQGKIVFLWHASNRSTYVCFNDVLGSGYDTFWADQSVSGWAGNDTVNIANNCTFTNWGNFALYADKPGFMGLTGVSLSQKADAFSSGVKGTKSNIHGPIRLQDCDRTVVDSCDMFSRNGWFPNQPAMSTIQPGFRWAQAIGNENAALNMQRTFIESPGVAFACAPQDGGKPSVAMNVLIDKTHLIGGHMSNGVAIFRHTGVTVRNTNFYMPANDNHLIYGGWRQNSFYTTTFDPGSTQFPGVPGAETAPIEVYNCGFFSTLTTAQTDDPTPFLDTVNEEYAYPNHREENNLRYLPNLDVPETAHAVETAVVETPKYDGYRSRHHPFSGTFPADIPDGGSFTVPYAALAEGGVTPGASDFINSYPDARYVPVLNIIGTGLIASGTYSFDFDATGVVVTNNTGTTWASGGIFYAGAVRAAIYHRPATASPADTIIRGRPLPGSTALGAAVSGRTAVDDMLGNIRPATPSIGAYELP